MGYNRVMHEYTLATGAGSKTGGSAITSELYPYLDLSALKAIVVVVSLTAAAEDAGDILDVALQETLDGVTWNDRCRFPQLLGNLSPSASAPETYQQTILALEDLDYAQIGEVLGITENNVGVRLNRARASLRKLMGETP